MYFSAFIILLYSFYYLALQLLLSCFTTFVVVLFYFLFLLVRHSKETSTNTQNRRAKVVFGCLVLSLCHILRIWCRGYILPLDCRLQGKP